MTLELIQYIRGVNIISVVIKLSLATLFGGIIGIERGKKNRPAGFRTHILVCIGSTLAMTTNQYIVEVMGGIGDPSRLGAQVISGVGFLGAGTILVTSKQQVKGLTTAAGLWASACMGLAIGIGFYEGAITGCIFISGVMTILNKIDNLVLGKSKIIDLYIEVEGMNNFKVFLDYLKDHQIKVTYLERNKIEYIKEGMMGFFITLRQQDRKEHAEIISLISGIQGVDFVEEI